MVSLKNLPHEFVYLHKASQFSYNFKSFPSISRLSTCNSAQFPLKSTSITRTSKPIVPSPYFKRGKTRISRMIRHQINCAVYFVHHEHKQSVIRREKDWKARYLIQSKGTVKYPYTINRVKLRKVAEEIAVKRTSRLMIRYNLSKLKRGK